MREKCGHARALQSSKDRMRSDLVVRQGLDTGQGRQASRAWPGRRRANRTNIAIDNTQALEPKHHRRPPVYALHKEQAAVKIAIHNRTGWRYRRGSCKCSCPAHLQGSTDSTRMCSNYARCACNAARRSLLAGCEDIRLMPGLWPNAGPGAERVLCVRHLPVRVGNEYGRIRGPYLRCAALTAL